MCKNILWKRVSTLVVFLLLIFAVFSFTACNVEAEKPTSSVNNTDVSQSDGKEGEDDVSGTPRLAQFTYELEMPDFTPNVPLYELKNDLSNVDFGGFSYLFSTTAGRENIRDLLYTNHYLIDAQRYVAPTVYSIYEDNSEMGYPSFITTDSVLHTYHMFFEALLENVESEFLIEKARIMTEGMLDLSLAQYEELKGSEFEAAAIKNSAFFGVASALLGNQKDVERLPEEAKTIAVRELEYINAEQGILPSPLLSLNNVEPQEEDYSQYRPRSHYTKSKELKQYFKAMMWYGRISFLKVSDDDMRSVILMTIAENNERVNSYWNDIYSVTEFFVGTSDDVAMDESTQVLVTVFGDSFGLNSLQNKEQVAEALVQLKATRAPKINSMIVTTDTTQPGHEEERDKKVDAIRFMGQRYNLDAEIFQNLIYSKVLENDQGAFRKLPKVLDVPAVFGSKLAKEELQLEGDFNYIDYEKNFTRMSDNVKKLPEETWVSNLYFGWLSQLKTGLSEVGEGYPAFMIHPAWNKKKLNTFLGSYTELKHDTVLYAKQAYACKETAIMEPADMAKGYVEPEPELYAKCAALLRATSTGLDSMNVLSEESKSGLSRFEKLCTKLMTISVKELEGTALDEGDYQFIDEYGGALDGLYNVYILKEDDFGEYEAAVVTDIATDPNDGGRILHIANAGFDPIYVIVPIEGQLVLAKGAVYRNYEFVTGLKRMTDEEWREIVNSGDGLEKYPPHRWIDDVMVK